MLSVSPHKLSIAGRKVHGKCVSQTRKNTRDKQCLRPIKLTISGAAAVTFTAHGSTPSREVKGKCVAPMIKNKREKKCKRPINVKGKLTETGTAGANSFAWNAKIGGRELAPGSYKLTATPAAGAFETVTFTIVG